MIGISPSFFDEGGILYKDCDEMIYTDTMHERKALLRSKADVFAITPGGVGTFDEFFEVLTLRQLGVLTKPIGILNLEGVYDPLLNLLEKTIEGGFMSEECRCALAQRKRAGGAAFLSRKSGEGSPGEQKLRLYAHSAGGTGKGNRVKGRAASPVALPTDSRRRLRPRTPAKGTFPGSSFGIFKTFGKNFLGHIAAFQ